MLLKDSRELRLNTALLLSGTTILLSLFAITTLLASGKSSLVSGMSIGISNLLIVACGLAVVAGKSLINQFIVKNNTNDIEAPMAPIIPNVYQAFHERRLIRFTATLRTSEPAQSDKPDFDRIKALLHKIDSIGTNPRIWKEEAPRIRHDLEGNELALVNVIKKHGQALTHELGRMIEMGNLRDLHSIIEGSLLRKLCFIFHPDKWQSPHSGEVFIALKDWVEGARDVLSLYCTRAEMRAKHDAVHKQLMREMKEYIERTNLHINLSREMPLRQSHRM